MDLHAPAENLEELEQLRRVSEADVVELVDTLGPAMLKIARMHVSSAVVAQDVVQEAWVGVLQGLDRFEGRSSVRTWVMRIVTNIAKTRGQRERRSVPWSSFEGTGDEPSWDPTAFTGSGGLSGGRWSSMPRDWSGLPEDRLLASETVGVVREAIDALPPAQAAVIHLHDVLGWSAEEVRNALDLSQTNQRVLLHRARAKVRGVLDAYLALEGDG
jgi:RNA polymerase sigma-70 factor (ECF subfamily)